MPLIKFEFNNLYGLKNSANLVLVEPIYDELYLTNTGAVVCKFNVDDHARNEILALDASGDTVVDIAEKLRQQQVDNILEVDQLNKSLFTFMYSNYESLELTGVFNDRGEELIPPVFDEIEVFSDHLLLCFHGAHYEEYDALGDRNYSKKLFDINGNQLINASIIDYEELADNQLKFITDGNLEIITDKFGRRIT